MSDTEERTRATVLAFAGTLIPGDDGFPAASGLDMAALLERRLAETAKGGGLRGLLIALGAAHPPFAEASADERRERVAKFEAEQPDRFAEALKAVYLTYYEQPQVVAAIRALGFVYNDAPLPQGYPPEPFDPARDAPRHTRGRWIPTAEVAPVDTAHLDHLSRRS
jgi:hypothetical protein